MNSSELDSSSTSVTAVTATTTTNGAVTHAATGPPPSTNITTVSLTATDRERENETTPEHGQLLHSGTLSFTERVWLRQTIYTYR